MFFRHTRFSYILYTCALTLADEGIRTFRAGEEEESPSGDSGCPARAAHKRTGRGPLVNHPGQRKGGVDSSSPLDSSLPPRRAYLGDSTALLNGIWSNGGWNKFHLAYRTLIYRGPYPVERY